MDQAPHQSRIRKNLRKSTQSCTECRRRKIRCTFSDENSSICTPCSARGSRCVDQRLENVSSDEKKSLRERVTRLEGLLDAALNDEGGDQRQTGKRSQQLCGDPDTLNHEEYNALGNQEISCVPLMSVLDRALGSENVYLNENRHISVRPKEVLSLNSAQATACSVETQILTHKGFIHNEASIALRTKQQQVCETLRSSLPRYDEIMDILSRKGSWWMDYRHKMYGSSRTAESLTEYAARIYTRGSPTELGILVSAYALSINVDGLPYLALVDGLIISDDEYATTLSGLECIILQGKCYLDIGQPKKTWLAYHRGLTVARLVNLHRTHRNSITSDNIWWVLYLGDRLMSVILGLPYSIIDVHCDLGVYEGQDGGGVLRRPFSLKCGIIAGKLVDRNQIGFEKSMSKTMEIDEELQQVAATMPQSWWDIVSLPINTPSSIIETRERLCSQVFWLLIRMHLYLPFLLKEKPSSGFSYEHYRSQCVESARMLLERYHILRSSVHGRPIYDSKTTDFVGFTASVILLIGTSQEKTQNNNPKSHQAREDWHLVEKSISHFWEFNERLPCKLFSQCHRALSILLGKEDYDDNSTGSFPSKISIPYFGTVSIHRPAKGSRSSSSPLFPHQSDDPAARETPDTNNNTNQQSTMANSEASPVLELEPVQMQHIEPVVSGIYNLYPREGIDGTPNETGDPFLWLNDCIPMMDIDQDWNWMDTA